MIKAYYKTNDPAVLAAMAQYDADAKDVSAAGSDFADHFGGIVLISNTVHGKRVAGLCFKPAKDDPLWTKPDPKSANMQRPRSSVKNATKKQKEDLAFLLADWMARFPQQKADLAPVLETMGTDWGALFFCGFSMFQHEGFIYAATSTILGSVMQEILGSEFHAAQAAAESIKAAV